MYIDGSDAGDSYANWKTYVETRMNVTTPLSLGLAGELKGRVVTATIQVHATGTIPTGTLVLHTVVTESNLSYTGPNGDPLHNDVMRRMYPDQLGETFVLNASETKTFQRTIRLDSSWVSSNCALVAFVQVNETKAIIQALSNSIEGMAAGVQEESPLPEACALFQNYPNPFNANTIIRYQQPMDNYVSLKVYDLLGREVATLVSEVKTPGTYVADWHAPGLASGVYLYRLTAGDFVEVKKMLLVR
jgi:hypothetical protein